MQRISKEDKVQFSQLDWVMKMSEEEMIEYANVLLGLAKRISFLIEEIYDEENPEVVNLYIDLLGYAKADVDRQIRFNDNQTIREIIRQGRGDYAKISEKCIRMNLV